MPDAPAPSPHETAARSTSDAASEALLERLRIATRGEYDVAGELGRGGMATVYLAHEISLDRKVAIKVMAPGMLHGDGLVERFKREARTAAALSHPHIIPIYAVREIDDLLFCVLKLVNGTPLDAIMREIGQLPIAMVQAILAQVGDALGYAERHGVVHRDIKPGNILIDDEGWAVVTDFGIAKVLDSATLTMTGVAVGTPAYMSPEQCGGDTVTGASDQYSLGVVAYEMLAGRPPFTGATMMALLYSHFHEEPPPLESLRPDCPPEMRDAVHRMLRKAPEDRFPSMDAAIAALGARPLAPDDPTRSQLITLARTGVTHRVVSQVHTPRSPIPLGRKSGAHTPAPSSTTTTTTPGATSPEATWRRPVLMLGGAIALLGVGYLMAHLSTQDSSSTAAVKTGVGAADTASAAAPSSDVATFAPAATSLGANAGTSSKREVGGRASSEPASPAATAPPSAPPGTASPREDRGRDSAAAATAKLPRETGVASRTEPAPPPPVIQSSAESTPATTVLTPTPARTPSPILPPPPDNEAMVRSAILSFAGAIASNDLETARQLYPTMPAEQREGFEAMWKDGGKMSPRWAVSNVVVDGNVATARVTGINVVTRRRGERSEVPVALRARLERRGSDWRLISLVN